MTATAKQATVLRSQSTAVSADTTVNISGTLSQFTIAVTQTGFSLTYKSTGVVQNFTKSDRLRFTDTGIAFNVEGIPGQAYRMYQTAFNRTPDLGGLGFQINALDTGYTLLQIAQNFIDSPEFGNAYGSLDTTAFVTLLYSNVLRRAPDAGGLAFYVSHLDGTNPDGVKVSRAQVLMGFSESPENKAAVLPAIANGIQYAPTTPAPEVVSTPTPTPTPTTKSSITAVTYDRSAMYRDEIGKTPVTIGVDAQLVTGHKLMLTWSGRDPATKVVVSRDVQLLDNGQGADKKAADGQYTAQIKYDLLPRYEYMGIANYEGRIRVLDQNGVEVPDVGAVKSEMSFVVVDRANTPSITKVADDVFASSSVVNVILPAGVSKEDDAKSAFKRALVFWPDNFDEAAFFYAGQVGPNTSSEYSYTVKDDTRGIGTVIYGPTGWGSDTLRHVQQLTGGTTGPFMHEFTHRWGFMLNDSRLHLSEYTSCACHFDAYNQIDWDPISVNGGIGIVKQTFSGDWIMQSMNGIPRYSHSDMMLYLMGLLDPSELPVQPWIVEQEWRLPQGQVIPAAHVRMLTVADIESVYGKRLPAYGSAPSTFRLITVLITRGRAALPEEMAAVQAQIDYYSALGSTPVADADGAWRTVMPFHASTKNRGKLIAELPAGKR